MKALALERRKERRIAAGISIRPEGRPRKDAKPREVIAAQTYNNALAENFFSIPKTEWIYRAKPATFEQAAKLITEYIFFYNYQRIQAKTKPAPPELRCQFAA